MTGYCADCDPILRATSIICGGCKAESFPIDAEWVSDRLILVTYDNTHEPYCQRRNSSSTIVADMDAAADKTFMWPARPRVCRAMAATTGKACRNPAGRGSAYCAQHDPARKAAT